MNAGASQAAPHAKLRGDQAGWSTKSREVALLVSSRDSGGVRHLLSSSPVPSLQVEISKKFDPAGIARHP